MSTKIFVNLPVKDLQKSIAFFSRLNFTFNPQFTDENATCMILGEESYVMLLVEGFFKTFTPKKIADTSTSTEVILTLSAESREKVDEMVNTALQAGGKAYGKVQEQPGMYGRSFQDLDGHLWEVMYLNLDKAA